MKSFEKDQGRKFVEEYPCKPLPSPYEPIDLLPEYCLYKDDGCSLAPSCLDCPLPNCVLDTPGGQMKTAKDLRNAEIVRLFVHEKKTVNYLADRFRVSKRTVTRVLTDLDKP
jgi:hypothetical protein